MTAERYTAVFTGRLSPKKPGECTYPRMGDAPLITGHYTLERGRPPYAQMGREISFGELPEGPQNLVRHTYRKRWDL